MVAESLKNNEALIVSAEGSGRNLFAILTGLAAERGHRIIKSPSGYIITQWGQTRHCPTIESLINALSRMGCDIPKNIASSAVSTGAMGSFHHTK